MPRAAGRRRRSKFLTLLRVQLKLAFREPYALGMGVALPVVLLVVFGFISKAVRGGVAGTGLSVIDLYVPTLMVIAFVAIGVSLPNTLVRDREIGWLRRVSTTPLPPWQLLGVQLIISVALAVVAIVIILVGGVVIFGASITVGIPFFILSLILSMAEIFALGLLIVALVPNQTVASPVAGASFFALLFLAGLWIQPAQIGGPLQLIMWYSPSGAAARALLYSVYNHLPLITTLIALIGYTVVFALLAVRYFRWE
ncbi:MAG: ABC transporter permease [Candidatus Dormibacteria bacterium]